MKAGTQFNGWEFQVFPSTADIAIEVRDPPIFHTRSDCWRHETQYIVERPATEDAKYAVIISSDMVDNARHQLDYIVDKNGYLEPLLGFDTGLNQCKSRKLTGVI